MLDIYLRLLFYIYPLKASKLIKLYIIHTCL